MLKWTPITLKWKNIYISTNTCYIDLKMISFLVTEKGDARSSFKSRKVTSQSTNRRTQKFLHLQDEKQRT